MVGLGTTSEGDRPVAPSLRSAEPGEPAAFRLRVAAAGFIAVGVATLLVAQIGATPGLSSGGVMVVLVLGTGLAATAALLPWRALPRGATLGLPVGALGLVVVVDQLSGFSTTPQAAAAYSAYVLLVLVWVGVTEPRSTSLAFSMCTGAVIAYVLTRHEHPALPVSSLAVLLPAGVALGETAAYATGRARALEGTDRRHSAELRRLARLVTALSAEAELGSAARVLAQHTAALFASPAAAVELVSADGDHAFARFGDGSATTAQRIDLIAGSGIVGRVELATGPTGRPREGLIDLYALQVAATVEQLATIEALGRAVRLDELTGTGNRRHAAALLASLRPGDAVMVIDVDHFKSVNDTWGHRAGDEELTQLGAYLQRSMRGSDDVARFGGDEFVAVARAAGVDAAATAHRLLQGWAREQRRTTLSIGVALHDGTAGDRTLEAADAALYQAKSLGRNQIVVA